MNKKKLFAIMFIVMLMTFSFTGSVAYYRYTIEAKIIASTGNAVFNVTGINNETKIIDLGNNLLPGDRGSFDLTIDVTGSTDNMYVTLKIERNVLPDNLKFYSTSDYKSELKNYYSFFEVNDTTSETITIYWYWNPFVDSDDDNSYIGKSLSANLNIDALQIKEYAMMKNGVTTNNETNETTYNYFWKDEYRPYIKMINFSNNLSILPSSCTEENLCFDISYDENQSKKVYGYLVDTGLTVSETDSSTDTTVEKSLYNLYIVSEAPIFAPSNCDGIFYFAKYENNKYVTNLETIKFNNNFNTSKVTNMSYMFGGFSSLTSLDLSGFNTSNVTNMEGMFDGCSSLMSLDLSSFNTLNVTNMEGMFDGCSSLTSLDLSNFNTSNVMDMEGMFYNCLSLASLDLNNFNTSNVTSMYGMFYNCESLTNLDLSGFNTSKVTDMRSMFYNCKSLTSLDLSNFNTSSVTNMDCLFYNCSNLITLDLSGFNTSKVTDMEGMFFNCLSLTNLICDDSIRKVQK